MTSQSCKASYTLSGGAFLLPEYLKVKNKIKIQPVNIKNVNCMQLLTLLAKVEVLAELVLVIRGPIRTSSTLQRGQHLLAREASV